jgi:hypothetical protein
MTGLALGLASSASANTDFPSSSPSTSIPGHEVDTGVIVLQLDPSEAGLTAAVLTPDPADTTGGASQIGVIGSDGSVSIRAFAGPAAVYLKTADGQVHELGGAPLPGTIVHRQAAAVYRAQTVEYTYSSADDTFTLVGATPSILPAATQQEAETQIPVTHYTTSPTTFVLGQPVTLQFSSLSPNGIGDPNYGTTVTNYGYAFGPPADFGPGTIVNGGYAIGVPAEYTTGGHAVVSYDAYGRLVTITTIGTAPVNPGAPTLADHLQDSGTVRLNFGPDLAGMTVTLTASDPTVPGTFAVVSNQVDANGYVILTDYAGFADVDFTLPAPTPSSATPSIAAQNAAPSSFRYDIGIYRAQSVIYDYAPDSNGPRYIRPEGVPTAVIPATGTEAESLTPVATSTVSPTTWQPGSDLPLHFTDVTPTGVGYPFDTLTVQNVVYSAPTPLGSTPIYLMNLEDGTGFSYSVTVPGAFTGGGHVFASFDDFGRLVSVDPLDQVTPTTPTTTEATAAAGASLANTGQNDLVPAGIAALVLFGAGATVLAVSYRRRASGGRN